MGFLTDIFGGVLSLGSSVASGGLFGLLGSVVGVGAKFLQRRQDRKDAEAERAHELKLIELQSQASAEETEREIDVIRTEQEGHARIASYQTPIAVQNVHTIVNDIRALFRPFLTLALVVASVWVLMRLMSDVQTGVLASILVTEGAAAELITYMVNSLFFTTSTAVVWWFGDRALTPPHLKHK